MAKSPLDTSLTILMPLKDRARYTARILGYYNALQCPFKFLIADGGSHQRLRKIMREGTETDSLHYEYVEYPYDEDLIDYHTKMADVVDKIDTPFTLVMDNDDFFFMTAAYENMNFLINNPDYASSRGALNQIEVSDKVYGELKVRKNLYTLYPDSITGATASERILDQSKHFHSNWHNVTRSEYIKVAYKLNALANPSNFRFTEQIICYLNILWGNGNRQGDLFLLHQVDTPRTTKGNHFPAQKEWINSDYWVNDFSRMTDVIAAAISHCDGIDVATAQEGFRSAYIHKLPGQEELLREKYEECKKIDNSDLIAKTLETLDKYDLKNHTSPLPFQIHTKSWQELQMVSLFLRTNANDQPVSSE